MATLVRNRCALYFGKYYPIRHKTDIKYYDEVDNSHLHEWEMRSTKRKFLLKLEHQKDKKVKELMKAQEIKAAKKNLKDIAIPDRIERGPADVLRLLASTVGQDFTAPDYRFHDDPYLIPYNSMTKRDYVLCKESGRKAARYILNRHPQLFLNNLIEAQPPIEAFMPKAKYDETSVSVELLENVIGSNGVVDSIEVYEMLKKKGIEISDEMKQALLELIAYNNEDEEMQEDSNETAGLGWTEAQKWKDGSIAEELYSDLAATVPEARLALLCGMARHRQLDRARQVLAECRANNVELSVEGYNAAILATKLEGSFEKAWTVVTELLTEMKNKKVRPNIGTLNAIIMLIRPFGSKEYSTTCQHAQSIISEFKNNLGIEPSLGTYKLLLDLSCTKANKSHILIDIMKHLEGKDMSPARDKLDFQFFRRAMDVCDQHLHNLKLAYQVHELLLTGGNEVFLSNYNEQNNYYASMLNIIRKVEPIDVTMEFYNRITPHTYSPNSNSIKALIQEVHIQGGVQHLPKIWMDLQVSNFGAVNLNTQREMTRDFLDILASTDLEKSGMTSLSDSFVKIARDAFEHTTNTADYLRNGLSLNNFAAYTCDSVIQIALKYDQHPLAYQVMRFCSNEITRIPGNLKEVTVMDLCKAAIEDQERVAAVDCVKYAGELSFPKAVNMANDVAKSFDLDPVQKTMLNQLFDHSPQWTNLK